MKKIAEYKRVSTELVERTRYIENEDGTITEESYAEEVPIMGLVYRDETEEERLERERLESEMPPIEPTFEEKFAQLEERFNKLIDMQGLTVQQIDSHQFEVIKPSFDADNPIPYVEGMELTNNAFYLKDGKVYVWMGEWVEW